MFGDSFEIPGNLRHQDHIRAAGYARRQRDLTRVATHDLEYHDPIMTCRGGLQTVDRLGRDHDGGVVADRTFGGADIIVDGLGNADESNFALLSEAAEDGKAAVTADSDQCVEAKQADALDHVWRPVRDAAVGHLIGKRVAAVGGAEDRAGHAHHGEAGASVVEFLRVRRPVQQALGTMVDAKNAPAVALCGTRDNRADHCIEPGAIAAAGQYAKLFLRRCHNPNIIMK